MNRAQARQRLTETEETIHTVVRSLRLLRQVGPERWGRIYGVLLPEETIVFWLRDLLTARRIWRYLLRE